MIKFAKVSVMIGLIVGISHSLSAATFTVSKDGRGQYTTIQAAINKAGPGDEVIVLDAATYPEQVTIDSTKSGLTLASSDPLSLNKPKIVWQDIVNVGPKTCVESKNPENDTYERNGALQLLHVHGVIINGITVDGGGPKPFGYPGVWSSDASCTSGGCYGQPCPLFHGNSAVVLLVSSDIIIRNCDISNAYFGIYLKDHNEGGIFANANYTDVQPWTVVPFTQFGRTGNHVFEYNRIHNNSYAFFSEAAWDLGSTIRYNLFYENRHASDAAAAAVNALPDGDKSGGGVFLFKDLMLSPLAIYNNTFWHNSFLFVGNWQAGPQHLIFNNIFAQPFKYWPLEPTSSLMYMEMDLSFTNRMHNCTYSAQMHAPTQYSVQIMNGFQVAATGIIPQGASITMPFPVTANVKWCEPTFLSTDPSSANFLVPDWNDTNVQKCIVDQGWVESGVKDPDGTIADLGAISKTGGRPLDLITIKPTFPVTFSGTAATLQFNVASRMGTMTNLVIKYLKYINNIKFQSGSWGPTNPLLPNQIIAIPAPSIPIKLGPNTLTVIIPAGDTSTYAFFEMIIEGTGSDGKLFTTATGFIPFRKLDYKFAVEIWDLAKTKKLDTLTVGDTVNLRLNALKLDGSPFTDKLNPVKIALDGPGDTLFSPGQPPSPLLTIPDGVTVQADNPVIFLKVPTGNYETVYANGSWINSSTTIPFIGSKTIFIKSGTPEKVVFQNPPSNTFGSNPPRLDPGVAFDGSLNVYDKYGNRVNVPAQIMLRSLSPSIGDIVGGTKSIITDATGAVVFGIQVTNGKANQLFTITATLTGKNTDSAEVVVGQPRPKLWVFYADTAAYAPLTTVLQGQIGDKLKMTVVAGKNPRMDSLWNVSLSISINGSTGLLFYSSQADRTPSTSFMLVNGRVDVWVSSAVEITNGSVSANPDTNTVLPSDARGNIYFVKSAGTIPRLASASDSKKNVIVTWYDLRGRIANRQSFTSGSLTPSAISSKWKMHHASSVYFMQVEIKDKSSFKVTRQLFRIAIP